MPWYGWLAIACAFLVVVDVLSIIAVRSTERGRRFLHLSVRRKLRCLRALLRDPEVPWWAKAVLFVVVGYVASPLDLIPDFIPVLGQLDDIGVVIGGLALLLWLVPADRFDAALDGASPPEADQEQQRDNAA